MSQMVVVPFLPGGREEPHDHKTGTGRQTPAEAAQCHSSGKEPKNDILSVPSPSQLSLENRRCHYQQG